ncbi:MAG: choice-of-anchor tandem repeat GloVer-containing protein [Candidatus Sulfotelmatobacter sp.]
MNARKTLPICLVVLSLAMFTCSMESVSWAQTLTTLTFFNGTNGAGPSSPVVQGIDGNFYGTTINGPDNFDGVIFKITPEGTLTTVHVFGGSVPLSPSGIIQGADGNLYGTTGGSDTSDTNKGTVFKITPAGTLTTIAQFNGVNGWLPNGLIQGADGNFYGTTVLGGSAYCNYRCGVVFKITPQGVLSTLHRFTGMDGNEPYAVPVQGNDGNFYGTTENGGSQRLGTIYKMTPQGVLTVLHSFAGNDGAAPLAGLIQASDGSFYGTTQAGGLYRDGTLYKITADGTFTTLLNFNDSVLDANTLIRATDGNLYGTAAGIPNAGSIFVVRQDGTLTVLYTFSGVDGAMPLAALFQATDGKFYGSAYSGGLLGLGSVFSFSMDLSPFIEILNTSGKTGASVPILGDDLTGTTSVAFNGISAAFTVVSDSEIIATVPPGATSGTVQATTTNGTLGSNVPFRVIK